MEIPLRTAYGQNGRCGMQPKAKHSLHAQAHQSKSRTETVKRETLEKKLGIREKRRTREVFPTGYHGHLEENCGVLSPENQALGKAILKDVKRLLCCLSVFKSLARRISTVKAFDDFSQSQIVALPTLNSVANFCVTPSPLSKRFKFVFTNGDRFNSCQVIYSQFGLAIHQNDHQARRRFVEWAQNEIAVVPDFHKRILFSDEAHFWLNGYVNKQNWRIWCEANLQVYVETPLHPEKLTVWCALWASGIIGPYFFKNDEGHNVTVNGDRYTAMITNFFIPELNKHDVQELWFQQDGATCHTARATIDLLKDTFGDRLISRFGPVNWPPRSCDLTPLDFFLWDYVKSLVYAVKPQTLDHLEDNIRRVIADIRPQMLEKVIENWTSRLDYIRASRGSHICQKSYLKCIATRLFFE
ncbi:uncharacterized protein TNCV_1806281 [Trichonephila clavipes]|nr:uncharacterized protein TNCV_1806281 [Trichonephila clavipes]